MNVYQLTFICPDMESQADVEMIRETVLNSPGVGDVTISLFEKTVVVSTANQDAGVDVRSRLFNAGFPPDEQ
jgi:hypothetical protein